MRCLGIGEATAKQNLGVIDMIDKSAREREAIKETRRALAETLTRLGLMEQFFHRSAEDIDAVIEACLDGFHASLTRQARELNEALGDEIPF